METLDTFFKKLSLLVLGLVDLYGRVTDSWHPVLAIAVPVGIFVGIKHLAPAWLFMGVSAVVFVFSAAFLVTIAYVFAYGMTLRRD